MLDDRLQYLMMHVYSSRSWATGFWALVELSLEERDEMMSDERGFFYIYACLDFVGGKKRILISVWLHRALPSFATRRNMPNDPDPNLQHSVHGLLIPVLKLNIRASEFYSRAVVVC